MILLTSGSLTPVKLIDEQEKELTIRERDSTASISVTSTDGISVNSWIKDDNGPGTGIVWRVTGIRQNFGKGLPEVDLEHVINTLKDRILFGEITPETIAGSGATTCTALQAVTYILNQQSDWVLGTFSFSSVSSAYKFDGDNLLDALKKVSNTLEEPWWSYDMSSYPFTLNITAKPSGVACEMRAGRNLETISRTIDKTGMYTRFYPIGKDDLHISGNYVSKNESTYGIISKVETDQSIDTTAVLTAWANERLNKHAQPRVNITAKGLAIADATGEALDSLTLGRICRVPLPEYSTTIEERITELHYADAKNKPEDVNVTLSNEKDDRTTFAQLISNEIKSGAGPSGYGARGGARQQKEDHAWLEDNTDSISMVVGYQSGNKYIRAGEITLALNRTGEGGSYESAAYINANHVNISGTNTVQTIAGAMEMDASGHLVIKDGAGFRLRKTVSGSTAEFGVYDQNNLTAGVAVGIINGSTSLKISADRIDIDGIVEGLTAYDVEINSLDVNDIYCSTTVQASSFSFDDSNLFTNCIVSASVSGNVLTLTDAYGDEVTFSKATAQTGSWGSGVFTSTVSQNGVTVGTLTTSLTAGQASWSGKTVTIPIYATIGSGATVYNTGKTVSATYSGGGDYDAGWNACRNAMIESQWYWTGYTGSVTTKYDAPTYGAQARSVIYPYESANHYRYSVPDPR